MTIKESHWPDQRRGLALPVRAPEHRDRCPAVVPLELRSVYTEEASVDILAVVSLEHHPSGKASICVCGNLAPVISIGLKIFIIKLPFA